MSHDHAGHSHAAPATEGRLALAVLVNVGLTVVQVVGGILSGSLALVADALHNFSDAASLGIAWGARRIARRPADASMTFGYARAEIVAALINFTTLIILGLYLAYEAVLRLLDPQPILGWTVVVIAAIALVIDLVTAFLTYAGSKDSMNIRAAFLHNVADALGSVAVIFAGTLVLLYDWTIVDPLVTLAIAAYVLWHGGTEIGGAIRILMNAAPDGVDTQEVAGAMTATAGVADVHHVHLWRLDERRTSLEAHVALDADAARHPAAVKARLRTMLTERFGVGHVTIETELPGEACAAPGGVLPQGGRPAAGVAAD
jgi:cobalt-zinc-cadmium efflux system protein